MCDVLCRMCLYYCQAVEMRTRSTPIPQNVGPRAKQRYMTPGSDISMDNKSNPPPAILLHPHVSQSSFPPSPYTRVLDPESPDLLVLSLLHTPAGDLVVSKFHLKILNISPLYITYALYLYIYNLKIKINKQRNKTKQNNKRRNIIVRDQRRSINKYHAGMHC
jgi:hypothetical protein